MEITIRVPELTKALARVQGIVEKKTTMPILANVLITAKGKDAVAVSATDLEIGLTADYEAKVAKPGAMTLDAKALYAIVRALPEQTVTLTQAANKHVEIKCGRSKFRLVGADASSFPTLPKFDDVPFFAVDPKAMHEMIEKTIGSASTDETRYNLTGVYFEPHATGLRLVSTDGHRLALVERELAAAPVMRGPAIVPRKGLGEARKLLDGTEGEARLGFVENSAVLECGGVTLTMRLVDGRFPEYGQVIPTTKSKRATVDRADLVGAIKRVSLLAPDKGDGIAMSFVPGDDAVLTVRANDPDAGEASEDVAIEYEGDALKIGFNWRYVLDALGMMSADKIHLDMTDELSPGIVRADDAPDFAVLMPMRI